MTRISLIAVSVVGLVLGIVSTAAAMQIPSLSGPATNDPFANQPAPIPPQGGQPASQPGAIQPSAPQTNPVQPPANGPAPNPGSCDAVCQPQMIERTIYVPTPTYQKRTIQCVEYTTEQRQKAVTVLRMVPETKPVTQQYCVLVPEKRQRTENYTVCKAVPTECNGCGCGPCKYVEEPRQRVIEYTVCVPQMRTRTVNVTTCKYVPEQRSVTVDVCVPHTVEKQVDVCVYQLVAKKVLCPAPVCYGPSCGYGGCW